MSTPFSTAGIAITPPLTSRAERTEFRTMAILAILVAHDGRVESTAVIYGEGTDLYPECSWNHGTIWRLVRALATQRFLRVERTSTSTHYAARTIGILPKGRTALNAYQHAHDGEPKGGQDAATGSSAPMAAHPSPTHRRLSTTGEREQALLFLTQLIEHKGSFPSILALTQALNRCTERQWSNGSVQLLLNHLAGQQCVRFDRRGRGHKVAVVWCGTPSLERPRSISKQMQDALVSVGLMAPLASTASTVPTSPATSGNAVPASVRAIHVDIAALRAKIEECERVSAAAVEERAQLLHRLSALQELGPRLAAAYGIGQGTTEPVASAHAPRPRVR